MPPARADALPDALRWKYTAPVIVAWRRPDYPPALLAAHRTGDVSLRIVVNDHGAVVEARVLKSFDARADPAASADILQWTFRPARVADINSPCALDVTVRFRLPASPGPLPPFPPASEMPREVTQTLPEPIFTPNPDYPAELAGQGIGGAVRLLLLVGASGKVLDYQLQNDADPGFGREAGEVVGFWTFKPAHQGDLKVPALYEANLIFSPH